MSSEGMRERASFTQLLQEIAVAANEAKEVDDLLQFAVAKVCLFTGWPVGHVYYVSSNSRQLTPSKIWHLPSLKKFHRFRQITEQTILNRGEGLPGRILESGRPIWIVDASREDNFPRARMGDNIVVRAAFGFPVLVKSQTVAVLEFFCDVPQQPDTQLLQNIDHVGTQLGRVVERKQAEEQVKRSREQLRALSAHLQFIREEERTKIAREIHDELGQVLTALKMDLSLLRQSLLESSDVVPRPVILTEIDSMSKLVEQTIHTVRRIVTELRPEVLDHLDLRSAIEWQAQEFRTRSGIDYEFESNTDETAMNKDLATAVFRIFQETLTNVVRHAGATKVNIVLEKRGKNLVLEVDDNGRGITPAELASGKSFGLMGIRERALLLGGDVRIEGTEGKGTTVKVSVPLAEFN